MRDRLRALNKTPGVLGSAYVEGESVAFDFGEALGGPEAAPLARRTAEACRAWIEARPRESMEAAVFVGESGRIVARPAGAGMLVAFAENDASAGLLRLRLREIADELSGDGSPVSGVRPDLMDPSPSV